MGRNLDVPSAVHGKKRGKISTLWGELILLAGMIVLDAFFISPYQLPTILTGEELAHHLTGRRLVEEGSFLTSKKNPLFFFGEGHLYNLEKRYLSKYPPGHSLLLALSNILLGSRGTYLINSFFGIFSLLLVFFIGRDFFGAWAGALSAFALAISPPFLVLMSTSLPQCSSLFFLLSGVLLSLRGMKRGNAFPSFIGGILCGYAAAIQYSNLWIGIPLLVYLFSMKEKRRIKRAAGISWIAGILLPLTGLLLYNRICFGGPFVTGFQASGLGSSLNLLSFGDTLSKELRILLPYSLTLLLPFSLLGFFLSIQDNLPKGLFLVTWFLTLLLMEAASPTANSTSPEELNLTPLPPLIIAAAFLIKEAPRRLEIHRGLSVCLLLGLLLLLGVFHLFRAGETLSLLHHAKALQLNATRTIFEESARVPPGSVIIAKGELLNGLKLHLPSLEFLEFEALSPSILRKLLREHQNSPPSGLYLHRLKQILKVMGRALNEGAFFKRVLSSYQGANRSTFVILQDKDEDLALGSSRKFFNVKKIAQFQLPAGGFLADIRRCTLYHFFSKNASFFRKKGE